MRLIRLPVGHWGWLHFVMAFVVVVIASVLPSYGVSIFTGKDASTFLGNFGQWLELVKFSGFVVLSIVGAAIISRRWPGRDAFGLGVWNYRTGVLTAVAMFFFYQVAVLIFEKLVPGAQQASDQVRDSLGIGKSLSTDIAVVLMITVGAPIGEEFVCRGFMFRSLRDAIARRIPGLHQVIPVLIASLLSSYFFMTMHGGDGQDAQLYMIGLMGVVCSLAYAYTGTLRTPVLIHGLNNAYAVLGMSTYFANPTLMWTLAFLSPVICLLILDLLERTLRIAISERRANASETSELT